MRIALGIEYDGQYFHGWQKQQHVPSIQACLEHAIQQVANHPIKVFCAGRTDAGVHAISQVIHFETEAVRQDRAWVLGVNSHLPSGISVLWSKPMPEHFHARFSALSRRYRYLIYNHPIRPALWHARATWHGFPLDIEPMRVGLKHLLGENDFSSFRSSQCESNTPMRNLIDVHIEKKDNHLICVEIEANAFLHHMVRNIMGVILPIGEGKYSADWAKDVLLAKDRKAAGETAPPQGLYLLKVNYPDEYGLNLNNWSKMTIFF